MPQTPKRSRADADRALTSPAGPRCARRTVDSLDADVRSTRPPIRSAAQDAGEHDSTSHCHLNMPAAGHQRLRNCAASSDAVLVVASARTTRRRSETAGDRVSGLHPKTESAKSRCRRSGWCRRWRLRTAARLVRPRRRAWRPPSTARTAAMPRGRRVSSTCWVPAAGTAEQVIARASAGRRPVKIHIARSSAASARAPHERWCERATRLRKAERPNGATYTGRPMPIGQNCPVRQMCGGRRGLSDLQVHQPHVYDSTARSASAQAPDHTAQPESRPPLSAPRTGSAHAQATSG